MLLLWKEGQADVQHGNTTSKSDTETRDSKETENTLNKFLRELHIWISELEAKNIDL